MKPNEIIAFIIAIFVVTFFSLWLGAGLGITFCANSPDGYTHKFFNEGYKAYCEVRK